MKRFALWLAWRVGALPRILPEHIVKAANEVAAAQRQYARESAEFRRHVAYRALTEAGVPKRAAALAIEIAVQGGAA